MNSTGTDFVCKHRHSHNMLHFGFEFIFFNFFFLQFVPAVMSTKQTIYICFGLNMRLNFNAHTVHSLKCAHRKFASFFYLMISYRWSSSILPYKSISRFCFCFSFILDSDFYFQQYDFFRSPEFEHGDSKWSSDDGMVH